MKKILYIFISVLVLVSCVSKEDDPELRDPSKRTVLAYFLTNGLSPSLQDNVVDMFEGLQNTNQPCTIMIFWDNYVKSLDAPSIIKLSSDGNGNVNGVSKSKYASDQAENSKFNLVIKYSEIKKSYSTDINPIDKDFIATVIKDMISYSSTANFGLIFGSHAESWLPSTKIKYASRAFANTYGDGISIPDLNETLLNVGKKFDYILMDACMMGNIEVAYELQNTCDYYIASPMEVPSAGFPYSTIVPYLFSDNASDYAAKVCDAYCSYHTQKGAWGNCVAIDCAEIADFTYELKDYVDKYNNAIDLTLVQHYYKTSSSYVGLSYDILDFVNKITSDATSYSFKSQLGKMVVAKAFTTSTYSNFPSFKDVDTSTLCGLGMYIPIAPKPEWKSDWNSYIKTGLLWGDASGWSDYITRNNF